MKKLFLFLFLSIGLIGLASAGLANVDTQTFQMRFIVPLTEPTFTNLRNFIHYVNEPFSQQITATSTLGIECYVLNDTTKFDVDCSGTITNVTNLNTIGKVQLEITANNSIGQEVSGEFFIDIRESTTGAIICRYKKLGFYNEKYPFLKEVNCL